MTDIELCEGCTTPTIEDEMSRCDVTGVDYCGDCMGEHAADCSLCAYERIDFDIRRPGK